MKAEAWLKTLVILMWMITILGVLFSIASTYFLPSELRDWLADQENASVTLSEWLLLIFGVPLIIAMIVASVGLFLLRRWGAWLYAITTFLSIGIMTLGGPRVEHPVAAAFFETAILLSGIVIGISCFSDVFRNNTQANVASESMS
jgi:hypothetical protein